MTQSANTQEHVQLAIEDRAVDIRTAHGKEALSTLFSYELACVVSASEVAEALLGKRARLTIRDRSGTARAIEGVIATAKVIMSDDVAAHAQIAMRPAVFPLTLGCDCRTYRNLSIPDIVRRVLSDHGLQARWSLVHTYARREYVAQFREDDWTFVCRLLKSEGIYFWFDHESGSELVFADASPRAPELVGDSATVSYVASSGLNATQEAIFELGPEARLRSTQFTIHSFDESHPDLVIAASHGGPPMEVYDAPGAGCTTPTEAARRARLQHESAMAHRDGVIGRAQSVRFVPGRVVQIASHPFGALDGRYLVTSCELTVESGRHGIEEGAAHPPRSTFHAIDAVLPFRSPQVDQAPNEPGISFGCVVGPPGEEIHPDEHGRVRVEMHWDRNRSGDASSGRWMRINQRATAESLLFPRVGWSAFVMNEEGSADGPFVFSRAYDAEHPPPYELPANKTRVAYRTLTTPGDGTANEIRYEDAQGAEEMFLHATRDMCIHVNNRKSARIKANHARDVGVDALLDVKENHDEHVVKTQTIQVRNNQSETVGAGRQKSIGGDETITVGGSRRLDVGGTISTDAVVSRLLNVGTTQIDTTLGDVTLASPFISVLVGGASIKMTAATMKETVNGVSAQTIGGAKLELAAKTRSLEVKGTYAENVGGLMFLSSSGPFTDTADTGWSLQTLGPLSTSAGEDLVIEGTNSVTFKCGGSVISVTKDAVEVSTPALTLNGGIMTVKGKVTYN